METKHTVIVVDDDPLVRRALSSILGSDSRLEVSGLAADGHEAVSLASDLDPDLVLMDIHMSGMDGMEAIRRIKAMGRSKVVALTVDDDEDVILNAIESGADGFLIKDCDPVMLIEGIHKVLKGMPVIYPELSDGLLFRVLRGRPSRRSSSIISPLTKRETDVLHLLTKGMSNREISDSLAISVQTVKTHVSNILEKLGARDRTQAALIAVTNHITR